MTARRKKQKFRLINAGEKIDFRHGYKRCVEPGLIIYDPPSSTGLGLRPTRLIAKFWRNRDGGLFVRLNSSYGYVFHYEAVLINGKPVPDKDLDEFIDFIEEVLEDWRGTDDEPNENFYICEPDCPNQKRQKGRR
jgi:hypothetical protein